MSAVGNYVHLYAKNYLAHGIKQRKGSSPISEILAARAKMRLRATTRKVNKEQVEELERQYNTYKSVLANSTDKNIERIKQSIIDSLMQQYGQNIDQDVLQKINFMFSSGNIGVGGSNANVDVSLQKARQLQASRYSFANSVQRRLEQASQRMNQIDNLEAKNSLISSLNKIEQDLQQIINTQAAQAQEVGLSGAILKKGSNNNGLNSGFGATVIPEGEAKRLIDDLNSALALAKIPNLSNWLGTFEEAIAQYCALKIAGESDEAIANLFEDLITFHGKIASQGSMQVDMKFERMVSTNKELLKSLQKLEKGMLITGKDSKIKMNFASSTASKADAYFTISTQSDPIGVSIKNYNMSTPNMNIGLVRGSPLIYFLLGMGDNRLATHYINILAEHEDSADTSSQFVTLRYAAAEGLSYALLYSALSGRGTGKTTGFADVFMINDNSKPGHVKMYDVGTLINAIIVYNQMAAVDIRIDNKDLLDARLANPEVLVAKNYSSSIGEAVQRRLTAVMHDAHRKKVVVTIQGSVFSTIA